MTAKSWRGDDAALICATILQQYHEYDIKVKYLDHETRIKDPHRCALITARTASNWRGRKERGGWNHKFEQIGNGGLAGSIQYGGVAIALRQGYAAGSTDDGTAGDIPGLLLDTNKVLD